MALEAPKARTRAAAVKSRATKPNQPGFFGRHRHVALYVPNLIGYLRIGLALYAFSVAFTRPWHMLASYLLSFICDELDGRFARMLNQTSTLGAVLDMVTDRCATSGLLVLLCMRYPSWHIAFISLVFLDVFSHWFQMYSSLLLGASSHKTGRSWLVRCYYTNRIFMGFCCVCCEVLWLSLFALGDQDLGSLRSPWSLPQVELPSPILQLIPRGFLPSIFSASTAGGASGMNGGLPWFMILALVSLPGVLVKQACNWVQLIDSVDSLAGYERSRMS